MYKFSNWQKSRELLPQFIFIYLLVILISAATTIAQSSNATLTGTVEDTQGATIPGAKVTITNPATGVERQATTNASGSFTIPLLQPGEYTVLVERDGFTRLQLTNIVLNVGDQKSIQIQLKVGDVNAQVEVSPDSSMVRTDGSVGTVIDRRQVERMPLNGLSFQSLLALTPGVILTPASASDPGQFSVNGQRTNSNYFTVDGVGANTGFSPDFPGTASGQLPATTASGSTQSLVTLDALQEFRIQTSSYAPEFGRQPGGQVQLVTRSGGNGYHGTIFDYFRNEALDANNWFNNASRLKRPATRQHQFGGTFSGPLPFFNFGDRGGKIFHSGKNRTFFFFSYEGLRLQLPRPAQLATVPSLALRNATLPQYKTYVNAFPLPNGAELVNGFAEFRSSFSDRSQFNAPALRVDHNTGPMSIFARFSHTPSFSQSRGLGLSTVTTSNMNNTSFTAGTTWLVSNNLISDLRFNFTQTSGGTRRRIDDFGGATVPTLSLSPSGADPAFNTLTVSIIAAPNVAQVMSGLLLAPVVRQLNVVENVTWSFGSHQWKFGGDFRRMLIDAVNGKRLSEATLINVTNLTAGSPTSGRISNYSVTTFDDQPHEAISDNLSLYVQDTWQATNNFSLTYGVRWEMVPPPRASVGPERVTVSNIDNIRTMGAARLAPIGTPLWETRYGNFAPRVGVSYAFSKDSKWFTIIRGGGGVFYDLGLGDVIQGYSNHYPNTGTATVSNALFPLDPQLIVPPITGVTPPSSLQLFDRNIELPRVYQWNAAIEQSLGKNLVTVTFVGSESKKLLNRTRYLNSQVADFPGFTIQSITVTNNTAYADYRSLQLQFQRRVSKQFQTFVNYSLSRSRDTVSTDVATSPGGDVVPVGLDFGNSSFNVRHNFTASISYEVPGWKGNKLLHAMTGGWGIDSIVRVSSGSPLNITALTFFDLDGANQGVRPNVIPGVPVWIDDATAPGGRRLNNRAYTAADNPTLLAAGCLKVVRDPDEPTSVRIGPAFGAFCTPQPNTQGNLPRNSIYGFSTGQIDISLRREFALFKKVKALLRLEVFNVTNTPSFSFASTRTNLSGTTTATFGISTQTLNNGLGGLSSLYQIGGSRSMQVSARISF